MFTGIVTTTGRINKVTRTGKGLRILIRPENRIDNIGVGDSVSVDGVCLTVENIDDNNFGFYVRRRPSQLQNFVMY